jgi:hypothetical protein
MVVADTIIYGLRLEVDFFIASINLRNVMKAESLIVPQTKNPFSHTTQLLFLHRWLIKNEKLQFDSFIRFQSLHNYQTNKKAIQKQSNREREIFIFIESHRIGGSDNRHNLPYYINKSIA